MIKVSTLDYKEQKVTGGQGSFGIPMETLAGIGRETWKQ